MNTRLFPESVGVRFRKSLILGLACAGLAPGFALADDNGGTSFGPHPALIFPTNNQGHILCTGSINSDGTVAAGDHLTAANTSHLSKGAYRVGFLSPCTTPTAAGGFFRMVQVDTLTTGSILGVSCSVADRAGVPSAVFVLCYIGTTLTDTSFTISVSK